MPGGNQESDVVNKIKTYKGAKDALDKAKKAPASASASQALKDAQRTRDTAWNAVKASYNTYSRHMIEGDQTPKDLDDMLRGYGTSEN